LKDFFINYYGKGKETWSKRNNHVFMGGRRLRGNNGRQRGSFLGKKGELSLMEGLFPTGEGG